MSDFNYKYTYLVDDRYFHYPLKDLQSFSVEEINEVYRRFDLAFAFFNKEVKCWVIKKYSSSYYSKLKDYNNYSNLLDSVLKNKNK